MTKLPILSAAVLISLFTNLGAYASDLSFDGSRGGGFSAQELMDQAKSSTDERTPVASTVPVSNELTTFWSNLSTSGIEKLCKSAQIQLDKNTTLVNVIGIGGGIKRQLKQYPDQRLALIDQVEVKLSATIGHEVLQVPNVGSFGVSVSGGVEGRSMVVRPLEDNRYCKQLTTLVKLYEMKTVLPVTAKRISKMEIGEIWKLPVTVRYGISAGIGANVNEVVNISIGAGETKERRPSVSLYRIDENNIRLRLRIDHVTVKSVGVSANTYEIPAGDIGLLKGEDILSKAVDRSLASQINKMIAFKLAYSHVRTTGQKLLLEFNVNPNDAGQVEQVVQFLQGDFDSIRKFIAMGLKFDSFAEEADGRAGVGELEDMAAQTGSIITATATFAGSDHYNGHTDNFNINIPVIHNHQKSWATVYHRYQTLKNGGDTVHVQQATRVSNGETLNIPFVGTQIKHNSEKNMYVINKESADGKVTNPALLYQQYEGLIGEGDYRARGLVDNANNVLKYAGMKGDGTTAENMIPAAVLFPPLPPVEHNNYDGGSQSDPTKTYKAVVMSFKLVFSDKAVQDIVFSAPQMIMKAYMNVMRETESAIVDKVMDLFTVSDKGEVKYDYRAVQKRLGVSSFDNSQDSTNPLNIVSTMARAATKFIEKISSVREESSWKGQSEQLAKVASSGEMKYEDFLKVVIQMVDTKDISSDIYIHSDKRVKGEPDVTQNYSMFNNRDNNYDRTLADVTAMRERFADPTDLTD
ncbi:MAG: hypothetical protein NTX59_08050 [Elusimicrobia bacterium]|nr:hypothetical protein [Elusimicrobiota bacterium]